MKQKLGVVMLCAGALLLAYLYAHVDKNTYLYGRNTDSSDLAATGILGEGDEITQSFTCLEDSLDGINIKASVTGDGKDAGLEYSLVDAKSGETLRSESVPGEEIQNNRFNKFRFPTLEGTRGKRYILKVAGTATGEGAGVGFYVNPKGASGERLSVRGEETQGTLAVRLLTHRFDLETFVVLLGIAAFITGFMKLLYKLFR